MIIIIIIIDRYGEKAIDHSLDKHTMQAFKAQKIDQTGIFDH
jgi:hypothetical protein